jgi:hypothetical protein
LIDRGGRALWRRSRALFRPANGSSRWWRGKQMPMSQSNPRGRSWRAVDELGRVCDARYQVFVVAVSPFSRSFPVFGVSEESSWTWIFFFLLSLGAPQMPERSSLDQGVPVGGPQTPRLVFALRRRRGSGLQGRARVLGAGTRFREENDSGPGRARLWRGSRCREKKASRSVEGRCLREGRGHNGCGNGWQDCHAPVQGWALARRRWQHGGGVC